MIILTETFSNISYISKDQYQLAMSAIRGRSEVRFKITARVFVREDTKDEYLRYAGGQGNRLG